ncbi:MAG TPA: hypothetical protein DSN98_00215 [Thermoplasmata archaeon]|jgi:hypothetical protein|nr:MAG TPA: hypothetical protein DSN98_00215 [Thermoplasmata archaeon]
MKRSFVLQIAAVIVVSGAFVGILTTADVYEDVKARIVEVLCLSCIKLEPKTIQEFTFKTVDDAPHPYFVTENLTKGPVFLHYSEDVCAGCEVMFPIVKQLFNIEFGKQDMFSKTVTFDHGNITYIYVNLDHTIDILENSFPMYDKDDIGGLPMFTIITLGYDHGTVRPYFTTLYGTLNVPTDAERSSLLREVLTESIEMYQQNKAGYQPT